MGDPSRLKNKARQAARALAVGVCLFALEIAVTLLYLAVNITNGGSIGMDILSVVAVILGCVGVLIFERLRRRIKAAMPTL